MKPGSGRRLLLEILQEHTSIMSKEDFSPEEWAQNPACAAEEALKCMDSGDTDTAIVWAMQAAVVHWGNQMMGYTVPS